MNVPVLLHPGYRNAIEPFSFGRGLLIDGLTKDVTLPSNFHDGDTKFTWNFLVIPHGIGFAITHKYAGTNRVTFKYFNQILTSTTRGSGTATVNIPIDLDEKLSMVSFVFDSSLDESERVKFYLDGVFNSNIATNLVSVTGGGDFAIGGQNAGGGFEGDYNELLFLSGIAADATQIAALWNGGNLTYPTNVFEGLSSSNALYYRCNQPDGDTVLKDYFSSSNNGILNNFSTPAPYFTPWVTDGEIDIFGEGGQSNRVGQDGDTGNPNYPFYSENGYYWNSIRIHSIRTDRPDAHGGSAANYFCEKYYELSGRKAVMVEVANGGSGLTHESTADPNNWSATGDLRGLAEAKIDAALAYTGKTSPSGFLWNQGEDEASLVSSDATYIVRSKSAMQDVIDWWQAKYPGAPFYITATGGVVDATVNLENALQAVRDMQQEIVDENEGVYMAYANAKDFVASGKMKADKVHINYEGLEIIGEAEAVFVNDNR